MGVKFTNNAYTTLASTISAGATSFDVASAATLPTLGAGDWTYVSLTDEVVKVTAISGVTCTCDAVAGGHSSGIAVELRMTSELLEDFAADDQYSETVATPTAGQVTFNHTYTVGRLHVFLNGVKLLNGVGNDFTATNGTTVVLAAGATTADTIEFINY